MKIVGAQYVIESWLMLLYVDCVMRFGGFSRVHGIVQKQQVQHRTEPKTAVSTLTHSIDLSCVFYFKQILCLQRSAALAILLRRHGWKAEMVIGVQLLPFLSHAWVEIDGQVINDKPYVTEVFEVMERC